VKEIGRISFVVPGQPGEQGNETADELERTLSMRANLWRNNLGFLQGIVN
jgi:hypothetical protein